jgi:hypothetical protein
LGEITVDNYNWEQLENHNWEKLEIYNWEQLENYNREQIENYSWEQLENYNREQSENYNWEQLERRKRAVFCRWLSISYKSTKRYTLCKDLDIYKDTWKGIKFWNRDNSFYKENYDYVFTDINYTVFPWRINHTNKCCAVYMPRGKICPSAFSELSSGIQLQRQEGSLCK